MGGVLDHGLGNRQERRAEVQKAPVSSGLVKCIKCLYNQPCIVCNYKNVVRPAYRHADLMDDLAYDIHQYLLNASSEYQGYHFVLIPLTDMVKEFDRNHRTIQRRICALKDEGLLVPVIKKSRITLYCVKEMEDQP